MTTETDNLATHVILCELRYKNLEEKIHNVEEKLAKMESEISVIKKQASDGFSEIKLLLEKNSSGRQIQMIATFGSIVTAIFGFIGYLLVKHS